MNTMKDLAMKRVEQAGKLFTKISDFEFDLILAAITTEERHRADPVGYPVSGKNEFYRMCWKAITKDRTHPGDPVYGSSDAEIAVLIDDLWHTTLCSRMNAGTFTPCW
jgi:hypothetical protein